jgi:CheY-like chemotaxis protein
MYSVNSFIYLFLDVHSNRKILRMLLQRKNIMTDVDEADNGQKAIDIIYANINFYQIIFMDNFMPILVRNVNI